MVRQSKHSQHVNLVPLRLTKYLHSSLLIFSLLLLGSEMHADVFISNGDGVWENNSTWIGGVAPGSTLNNGDTVIIFHDIDVTTTNSLIIEAGAAIFVFGGSVTTTDINVELYGTIEVFGGRWDMSAGNGNFKVLPGGSLTLTNTVMVVAENFQNEETTCLNNACITVLNGDFQNDKGITKGTGAGIWVINGNLQHDVGNAIWDISVQWCVDNGNVEMITGLPAENCPFVSDLCDCLSTTLVLETPVLSFDSMTGVLTATMADSILYESPDDPQLAFLSCTDNTNLSCTVDLDSALSAGFSPGDSILYIASPNPGPDTDTCINYEFKSDSIYILLPDDPLVCLIDSTTDKVCFDSNSGVIYASATGGATPYTFSIDGGITNNTGTFTGLMEGSYTVTVTDNNGSNSVCTSDVIMSPPELVCVLNSSQNETCNESNDGQFTVAGAGGTPPYAYDAGGGLSNTSGIFMGLMAGTYSVTISDENGCEVICADIFITEPEILTCSISDVMPETAIDSNNGAFNITVSGGTPAYSYSVKNSQNIEVANGSIGSDGGMATVNGLDGDMYSINVIDDNNCSTVCLVDLRNINFIIEKRVSEGPTSTGSPNEFEISYAIQVSNIGTIDTTYNLSDTLKYGGGTFIDLVSATYELIGENNQSGIINPFFDAQTDYLIVSNEGLASGQSETWEVTVIFELDLSTITLQSADCVLSDLESGTGLLNAATIDGGVPTKTDTTCSETPMPEVNIEKSVSAGPSPTGNTNEFEISYLIEVTNISNALAFYDLSDTIKYGSGSMVQNVSVAYDSGDGQSGFLNEDFDGLIDFTVIEEESVAVGMTDRFLVSVEFLVQPDQWSLASSNCILEQGETGTGLLNAATVDGGVPMKTDTACSGIPFTEDQCLDTLLIVGPVTVFDTIATAVWIRTDGEVIVNSSVVFNSPDITLNPGFEVALGGELTLLFAGCVGQGLSHPNGSKKIIYTDKLNATEEIKIPLPPR